MNNNELITVVIPTYKTDLSLDHAIASVLNQSYDNIEVIVVDDNNPDTKYRKVAEKIVKKYINNKKVKYIKHIKNKNGSAARNTGIANAKGKYIGFLDDDDFYYQDKIMEEYKTLIKSNADGCVCFYKKDGREKRYEIKSDFTTEILSGKKCPQTSSYLMTLSSVKAINGFDESYIRHQDFEFLLRYLEKYKLCVCPKILYEMTKNTSDNSADGKKLEFIKDKFLGQFEYLITEHRLNRNKIYSYHYSNVAFAYVKEKKFKDALRIIKKYFGFYIFYYFGVRLLNAVFNKL